MKIISGGRCSGKTSYIWEQCKKLKGKKLLIVTTTCERDHLRLERDRSKNENLKCTEIHSASDVFGYNAARGISWDYIFVDEMQSVFYSALFSNMTIQCTDRIITTVDKDKLVDIDTVWPRRTCDNCVCKPVCSRICFKQSEDAPENEICPHYHMKEEEEK